MCCSRRPVALAVVIAALVVVVPARASWSPATELARSGMYADVSVGPDGAATFAWHTGSFGSSTRTSVWSRRRRLGGGLERVRRLSPPRGRVQDVRVVANARGAVFTIWNGLARASGGLRVAVRTSSGSQLGSVQLDAFTPLDHYDVAVGPDGVANVVWTDERGEAILARRVHPDGAIEPTRTVVTTVAADGPPPLQSPPDLAFNAAGKAVVTWFSEDEPGRSRGSVHARTLTPDGGAGDDTVLATAVQSVSAFEPQIALAPDGRASVLWSERSAGRDRVMIRRVMPDGALARARSLAAREPQLPYPPVLAAYGDGTLLAAWSDGRRVRARSISAAGALGSTRTVSRDAPVSDQVQVTAAERSAIIGWRTHDRFGRPGAGSGSGIQARLRSRSGRLSAVRTLVAHTGAAQSDAPAVSLNARGDAAIAWHSLRSGSYHAESAFWRVPRRR